jgi:mannose-6-phosphate isomerase
MAIEHALTRVVIKPWGVEDLRPWSNAHYDNNPIGEIWYERSEIGQVIPKLLLKLLFTSQPLSIQVHPDDAFDGPAKRQIRSLVCFNCHS